MGQSNGVTGAAQAPDIDGRVPTPGGDGFPVGREDERGHRRSRVPLRVRAAAWQLKDFDSSVLAAGNQPFPVRADGG